jgi:hypothetical protein
VVTGFGDAVIVAADAAGLPADAFASGLFDGPHAAKKNNGRRIAIVGMNRFIKILWLWCLSNSSFCQVASPSQLAERFFLKLIRNSPLTLWLSYLSRPSCPSQ